MGSLLDGAAATACCQRAWVTLAWGKGAGGHTLWEAALRVGFNWTAALHKAVADAQACRAVWSYLYNPEVRAEVDGLRAATQEAARSARQQDRQRAERTSRFIGNW